MSNPSLFPPAERRCSSLKTSDSSASRHRPKEPSCWTRTSSTPPPAPSLCVCISCTTRCGLRMAPPTLTLWLLLVGSVLPQNCCQHWSYGLRPGGKRAGDHMLDTPDTVSSGGFTATAGGAALDFHTDVCSVFCVLCCFPADA